MAVPRSSLRVTRSLVIPLAEVEVRADPSGGPGGQHANRASTRVEVRFSIADSPSLGPRQRVRLLERLGPVAVATARESRSQARNREAALERLAAKLAAALSIDRPRVPTKRSRGAEERRLEAKRRRGETKRSRTRPAPRDHD